MNVADLMTRNVVAVGLGNSVRHAAQLMLSHRVSGLPVVDDSGTLVGLVTEGDLMRRFELGLPDTPSHPWIGAVSPEGTARDFVKRRSWRVADVMAAPVVTVTETTTIAEAAKLLDTRGIKRLPVLRDGRLVGILSRADLLHCIADGQSAEIARGDDAIRLSVAARLQEAGTVLGTAPTVTVHNGIVHLWGIMRTEASRDAARVVVEGLAGVNGLDDHTTVSSPVISGKATA